MKHIIEIRIERELEKEEIHYFETLTASEKLDLVAEQKQTILDMFKQEYIEKEHIQTLHVSFSE